MKQNANLYNRITGILETAINHFGVVETVRDLMLVLIAIIAVFSFIINYRKKLNIYSNSVINNHIDSGKYIRNIFFEVSYTKEVLRYFIYGFVWKRKLIRQFNSIYNNKAGDTFRKAYIGKNKDVAFHLNNHHFPKKIDKTIIANTDLHKTCLESQEDFLPAYSKTIQKYGVFQSGFTDHLSLSKQYYDAMNSRYMVLTGSAGNGKTNILCNIAEIMIKRGQPCILIDGKEIHGSIWDYITSNIVKTGFNRKCFAPILFVESFLYALARKRIVIVIDAVNENDDSGFLEALNTFINRLVKKYPFVKVIVACRSEYYEAEYKQFIWDTIQLDDTRKMHMELGASLYDDSVRELLLQRYKTHFNFTGEISEQVKLLLIRQLLLLRMFFEVYSNSNELITALNKYQVFRKYIEQVEKKCDSGLTELISAITDAMLKNDSYVSVILPEDIFNQYSQLLHKATDNSVILSRKKVYHSDTIASNQKEEVSFVFDEMRDYCLARRIVMLQEDDCGNIDYNAILEEVKRLNSIKARCRGGVISYIYYFTKTNEELDEKERNELCKTILGIVGHDKQDHNDYYNGWRGRYDYRDNGIRIIMNTEQIWEEYEKEYIAESINDNPMEDGVYLFRVLLELSKTDSERNLADYYYVIQNLNNRDSVFCILNSLLHEILGHQEEIEPNRLIEIDHIIEKNNPNCLREYRILVRLGLNCASAIIEDRIEDYFKEKISDAEMEKECQKFAIQNKA